MRDELRFDNYVVAFIDLLGQGEIYDKYPAIMSTMTQEEREDMTKTVGKALFQLFDFHDEVLNQLEMWKSDKIPQAKSLPPDAYQMYRYNTKAVLKFQRFSDGFLLYMPIDSNLHNPLMALNSLLTIAGMVYMKSLLHKVPVRGGIEIGAGTVENDELYGPVIKLTYDLERDKAELPRIVIGDGIRQYLKSFQVPTDDMMKSIYENGMELCEALMTTDYDGVRIVDLFGERFASFLPDVNDRKPGFKAMRDFVEDQYQKYYANGNHKLATRYFMLGVRMDENEKNWTAKHL